MRYGFFFHTKNHSFFRVRPPKWVRRAKRAAGVGQPEVVCGARPETPGPRPETPGPRPKVAVLIDAAAVAVLIDPSEKSAAAKASAAEAEADAEAAVAEEAAARTLLVVQEV